MCKLDPTSLGCLALDGAEVSSYLIIEITFLVSQKDLTSFLDYV